MTLTQLRYLVAIADSGLNITLAAQKVHATQPGLSKQLKQLEDELGFRLFTRKGRSLESVTPAGAEVIERARAVQEQVANIRALAANLRADSQGELHIATTHTQARYVLPTALAALKQRYPQVAVHLAPGGDGEALGRLADGQADLAIVSTAGAPPQVPGLALPMFRWDRVVLVPRTHPLSALERPLRLNDLVGQPLVSYESSRSPESSLRAAFAAIGATPDIACTARDADLIRTYVRAGLGVGIMAEMAVRDDDDLVAVSADGLLPTCTTWLLIRDDRVLRDYTSSLASQLVPGLHARDLQRALGGEPLPGLKPPHWRELNRK